MNINFEMFFHRIENYNENLNATSNDFKSEGRNPLYLT